MNRSITIRLLIGLILFSSACSSSKFDYNTAYKFSQQNYKKTVEPIAPIAPIASLKPLVGPQKHLPADYSIRRQGTEHAIANFKQEYAVATKAEKRAMRKDITKQLKKVRKDMKVAKKEATQKDVNFNKKMYVGFVVLLAGIVVAILASGPIGALAIIVGVALIAWGFIEQA